jgi:hypothetical protein
MSTRGPRIFDNYVFHYKIFLIINTPYDKKKVESIKVSVDWISFFLRFQFLL